MADVVRGPLLPRPDLATENELELDERIQNLEQADIGALTDNSGGTTDGTVEALSTYDAATINDNFAELTEKVNALRTALRNAGLME